MGKRVFIYIVYSFVFLLTSNFAYAESEAVQQFTCETADAAIDSLRKGCLQDALKCKAAVDSSAFNSETAKVGAEASVAGDYGSGLVAKSIRSTGQDAVAAGTTGVQVGAGLTGACRAAYKACEVRVQSFAESYNASMPNLDNPDGDPNTVDSCVEEVDGKIKVANMEGAAACDGGERMCNSIHGNLNYMNRKAGGGLLTMTQSNMLKNLGSNVLKTVKGENGWWSAAFYGAAGLGVINHFKKKDKKKKREAGERPEGTMRFSNDGSGETCLTLVNGDTGQCFADADLVELCNGLTESSANYNSAMNKYGSETLDLICSSSNVTAAQNGLDSSGDSSSGSGESCDTTSATYYLQEGCTNQMLSSCTADINYGDCPSFYQDYCIKSGARGAGSNFCVYQASKDYCALAGTSAASPACGWVNYVGNNVAICGSNLEQYACYPAQMSEADYRTQCQNLGVSNTDPLCANLDTSNFYTQWRNPATSGSSSGTSLAGSDDANTNDTPTDTASTAFCDNPDNFYNPTCLDAFCADMSNSSSPICSQYAASQSTTSRSVASASVLAPDIASRDGGLIDSSSSSMGSRMCNSGLLNDCGPLSGVR